MEKFLVTLLTTHITHTPLNVYPDTFLSQKVEELGGYPEGDD